MLLNEQKKRRGSWAAIHTHTRTHTHTHTHTHPHHTHIRPPTHTRLHNDDHILICRERARNKAAAEGKNRQQRNTERKRQLPACWYEALSY